MNQTLGQLYLAELEAEAEATRKCLERVPDKLFDYKPTEKSMAMGNLVYVVADIARWIVIAIEKGEVNFANYEHKPHKTTQEVLALFDENLANAKKALQNVSDEELARDFFLKNGDQVLMKTSKQDTVGGSINHLVHHRGQLTVYMRMNNIAIPKIYGPSGDEQGF